MLGRVITGDEAWVYQYDPETKRQNAQRKTGISPQQKNSVSPNQESKNAAGFFYILVRLFIMNLYQVDKQSTKITIWKY